MDLEKILNELKKKLAQKGGLERLIETNLSLNKSSSDDDNVSVRVRKSPRATTKPFTGVAVFHQIFSDYQTKHYHVVVRNRNSNTYLFDSGSIDDLKLAETVLWQEARNLRSMLVAGSIAEMRTVGSISPMMDLLVYETGELRFTVSVWGCKGQNCKKENKNESE